MNRPVIRLAMLLAAVLLAGTVAFAVAEIALGPNASQIPTVTTATTNVQARPAVLATVTVPAPAVVSPSPPTRPADASTSGSEHEREVVKPAVRDDSDGDENGSAPSDGDQDDSRSSSSRATTAKSAPVTAKPAANEPTVRGTQSSHSQGGSPPNPATREPVLSGMHTQADASHGGSADARQPSSGKNNGSASQ